MCFFLSRVVSLFADTRYFLHSVHTLLCVAPGEIVGVSEYIFWTLARPELNLAVTFQAIQTWYPLHHGLALRRRLHHDAWNAIVGGYMAPFHRASTRH